MKNFFLWLMGLALICACSSEPDDPHRKALEEYAKSHIEVPESYKFDEMNLEFEHTYNYPLVEYRLKMQKYAEQPDIDLEALRAEDDKLQVLLDKFGFDKVCNEYHLWFWCKNPATGEKQRRAVKARYDMNDKLIGIVITPDSFHENPAVRIMKDKGLLDFCSHPEWFPNK